MIVALGGHAASLLRWQRRSKGRIWYAAASNLHEWVDTEKGTNRIKCWACNENVCVVSSMFPSPSHFLRQGQSHGRREVRMTHNVLLAFKKGRRAVILRLLGTVPSLMIPCSILMLFMIDFSGCLNSSIQRCHHQTSRELVLDWSSPKWNEASSA